MTAFMQFFNDLYKSRATYALTDLTDFLDPVTLPILATADREHLEEDISLEEVQIAIGRLQALTAFRLNFTPSFLNL